jgi:hypothetical protein
LLRIISYYKTNYIIDPYKIYLEKIVYKIMIFM